MGSLISGLSSGVVTTTAGKPTEWEDPPITTVPAEDPAPSPSTEAL